MKIYTRTGDDGTTSLSGGRRVNKSSSRVEAYGSVDELASWIGLLRDLKENQDRSDTLLYVGEQLMNCAAALASDAENTRIKPVLPDPSCLKTLEEEIDKMDAKLPVLNNFVLPGGNIAASYCHIARCVCRRAERNVLRLRESESSPEIINKFLNRLSDYLFVMSRMIMYESGSQEITWTSLPPVQKK
jgi:cob(I)alamin adenosyltransferase